jgi:hypothetical protein
MRLFNVIRCSIGAFLARDASAALAINIIPGAPEHATSKKNAMSSKCALPIPKRPPHDGCTVNGNSSRSVLLSLSRLRGADLFDHRQDERELPCDWPKDAAMSMSRE